MNNKIQKFKKNIENKKIAVIGIGVSNTPLIKFLSKNGARITACDMKDKNQLGEIVTELSNYVDKFSLGKDYLNDLNDYDYIFRTPGMRYDNPKFIEAKEHGALITSELELFFELCPCQIIGVTGSDGKTTTTTLIHLFLKTAGYKVWLGGNIGIPLIDKVEEIQANHKVVLELSSFQLHTFKQSPQISVITNISPNHLDYHTSYEEYINAKKNIYKFQSNDDKLILNYDNEITKGFMSESNGNIQYFSRINEINEGIMLKDNFITRKKDGIETKIIDVNTIKIPGVHNIENYMAAILAVDNSVSIDGIEKIASTFEGVEHRIEFVRELNGVKFYNDSIGTSPTRTTASIKAFKQKVILIAGGYDKMIPFDELGTVIKEHVKSLYLIGNTSDKIEEAVKKVDNNIPIEKCISLEQAVKNSFSNSGKNDIILLSPACASFDMFRDFAERGNSFKKIVNNL